jgi:RNA recognition motif-containing protein
MKIFVGNLSFNTTENDLTNLFNQVGPVESVSIITDRDTGRSKGFGFVAMSDGDASKAISQLSGTELDGRQLTINEARPLVKRDFTDRDRSGGGGNRRSGYGRY